MNMFCFRNWKINRIKYISTLDKINLLKHVNLKYSISDECSYIIILPGSCPTKGDRRVLPESARK